MANTTNLNLYKPTRDDYISVTRDISDNMQKIDDAYGTMDTAIDNLDESRAKNSDIAIVVTGSTSTKNINMGDFVVVKDSTISGIADGLYTALTNIPANISITSSNLVSVTNGGLNLIGEKVNSLKYKTESYQFDTEYSSILAMINDQVTTNGKKLPFSFVKVGSASLSDTPSIIGDAEFTGIVYGNGARLEVSINQYGDDKDFRREIFSGAWITDWYSLSSKIEELTTGDSAAADLNNITKTGICYANSNTLHAPDTWCIVYTFAINDVTISQIAMRIASDKIYYRRKNQTWETWQELALNSKFTPSVDNVSTNSWTTHQTALIAAVSKSGNIATLNLRMVFTDGYKLPVNTDFALIPSGFRPSSNIDMPALIQVNNADAWIPYVVTVQSTGYIKQGFTSNCTGIAILGASYTI